jgi:chromodomain-helicase-DNA-binding protein 4
MARPPVQRPALANTTTHYQPRAQPSQHPHMYSQQQGQMQMYPAAQAISSRQLINNYPNPSLTTQPLSPFQQSHSHTEVFRTNPNPPYTTQPLGSSKRPPSPTEDIAKKKIRIPDSLCPVCGGPSHLIKDCPFVRAGPKRSVRHREVSGR